MTKRENAGGTILADAPDGEASVPFRESEKGLMIKSVRIRGFRCFDDIEANDLGLVNIIVGDNGVGKTSLLEALFLLATNTPDAHFKFLSWRGAIGQELRVSKGHFTSGALWEDLFHGYSSEKQIHVEAKGTEPRSLRVFYREEQSNSRGGEQLAPIAFAWRVKGSREEFVSIPRLDQDGGLTFPIAPGTVIEGAFVHDHGLDGDATAERFSKLDIEGEGGVVTEAIRYQFPQITGLGVQSRPTGGLDLYASLVGQKRKVPLALISAGITRLVYILVNIAAYPRGTVFVDEFAKGLYHKRLPDVWTMVHSFAKQHGTQLFVSTHSGEAVTALGSTIQQYENDFRLVRVTRSPEERRSDVRVSSGKGLAAAIETHLEVR